MTPAQDRIPLKTPSTVVALLAAMSVRSFSETKVHRQVTSTFLIVYHLK